MNILRMTYSVALLSLFGSAATAYADSVVDNNASISAIVKAQAGQKAKTDTQSSASDDSQDNDSENTPAKAKPAHKAKTVKTRSSESESAAVASSHDTEHASAEERSSAKVKATKAHGSDATVSASGQTDIVANVDQPMVTNILPWQEKEGSIPKDELEFSALKDSLTPTDRDRLAGEIRYTAILDQPVSK